MDEYLQRATAAVTAFKHALDAFDERTGTLPPTAVSKKQRDTLNLTSERLHAAVKRLEHSLTQIAGDTALDVVDLQVRMEGECASLAAALKALDEIVVKVPAILAAADGALHGLEESAERLASAIFPAAVEGVREINRTLWEFRPLWNEYARTLAEEVVRTGGKRLTTEQIARIEKTADEVRTAFDEVNELLNELFVTPFGDADSLRLVIDDARSALARAVKEAKSKAADAYKPFHGVLKRAERLARRIDDQFASLRIPVFPRAESLDVLETIVDAARYSALAGVERFALLNIGARLRSTALADGTGHLLSQQFQVRVFDVFADRIYFTAGVDFIRAVEALASAGDFEEAPASLHRFKEGSFKQTLFAKGNLQLSYAFGTPEAPTDDTRVSVDADIDLYRSPARHLFGEVLVNHLTGSKTDQFKVWDILASTDVPPISGFSVVSV
jgi:hypothetical protein